MKKVAKSAGKDRKKGAAGGSALMSKEERDDLLMEHLPQVRYIARRVHDRLPQHVPFDDLMHAGIIGLIDAIEKYDSSKNVQFKSYAKFRIRGAILDSLRELDWSPRELRKKSRRIEEAQLTLRARLDRIPNEQEVAKEMGIELVEYQQLLGELRGLDLSSLQAEAGETGRDDEVVAAPPDVVAFDPFAMALQSEMKAMLAKAVGELNEKERQVLALYYFEELTMKEVGATLGVGESRVSQIHSAALVRVRTKLRDMMDRTPELRRDTLH